MRKVPFFIVLTFLLVSCTNKSQSPIDIEKLCNDLLSSSAFSEQLMEIDAAFGAEYYAIKSSDYSKGLYFFSSGATAEELSLFIANDNETADKIQVACKNRIDMQKDVFSSYAPLEVKKLEKAVVYKRGIYVIMYVAADAEAADAVMQKLPD